MQSNSGFRIHTFRDASLNEPCMRQEIPSRKRKFALRTRGRETLPRNLAVINAG